MFSVLRNRNFFLLWSGQVISQLGNNFNYIALAWLVLTFTGSAVKMGGVLIAQLLPNALFGILFGVFVDRWNRKRLMIVCDLIRGLMVVSIPILFSFHIVSLWYIYGIVFAVSSFSIIFASAEKAVIPQIVEEKHLTEANAFQEMTSQIASLIGPALAGVLVTVMPRYVDVLYIDASTFLISVSTIVLIRRDFKVEGAPLNSALFVEDVRQGLRFILKQRLLMVIICTAMAVNFSIYPFIVVFPIYSKEILKAGAAGFGFLMGAFGMGMLTGSLCASPLSKKISGPSIIYGGMGVVGISFLCMGFIGKLWMALFFSFLIGLVIAPGNAVILSLAQLKTPESLMGRMFSLMFSFSALAAPLGVYVATPLIEKIGTVRTLFIMGIVVLVCAGAGYCVFRAVSLDSTLNGKQEESHLC